MGRSRTKTKYHATRIYGHRQPGAPALDILGDRSDKKTGINQLRKLKAEVCGLAKILPWVRSAFV